MQPLSHVQACLAYTTKGADTFASLAVSDLIHSILSTQLWTVKCRSWDPAFVWIEATQATCIHLASLGFSTGTRQLNEWCDAEAALNPRQIGLLDGLNAQPLSRLTLSCETLLASLLANREHAAGMTTAVARAAESKRIGIAAAEVTNTSSGAVATAVPRASKVPVPAVAA